MISQSVALRNHVFQNGILACIVIATRTAKAFIRKAARSKWRLLLIVVVGTLLAVVALKLMALLGAAFDISFLRDTGTNAGPASAAGAAGAGAAGGAAGGGDGGGGGGGGHPPRHWWETEDQYLRRTDWTHSSAFGPSGAGTCPAC